MNKTTTFCVLGASVLLAGGCLALRRRRTRRLRRLTLESRAAIVARSTGLEDLDLALRQLLARAGDEGWLARLRQCVLIKPSFVPAALNSGLLTDPGLLGALARALRALRPDIDIRILALDSPNRPASTWVADVGLADTVRSERLAVVPVSVEPAFWSLDSDLPWPLPQPSGVVGGDFLISLGSLAVHPTERMIGMVYHHGALLPGIWDQIWDGRRRTAMAWSSFVMPPNLCLLDARIVACWSGPEQYSRPAADVLICAHDPVSADGAAARFLHICPTEALTLREAARIAGRDPADVKIIGDATAAFSAPAAESVFYEARTLNLLDRLPIRQGRRERWAARLTGAREPMTYVARLLLRKSDGMRARLATLRRMSG